MKSILMLLLFVITTSEQGSKVKVILHLDPRLVEECKIAAKSRNNKSLEEWITETIANAVSDQSILPKAQAIRPKAQNTTNIYCHMISDGSVYCYAPDGHIFRPRFDDFVMVVPQRAE